MWNSIIFTIGNIIGSGIFILPFQIKNFAIGGFVGFTIVSIGFMLLSILFSNVSSPMEIIKRNLGSDITFIVSLSYWIISWASTIIVVREISAYLSSFPLGYIAYFLAIVNILIFFYVFRKNFYLLIPGIAIIFTVVFLPQRFEILIVVFFVLINLLGSKKTFLVELILTAVKFSILIVIPIICFSRGKISNLNIKYNAKHIIPSLSPFVWCFLGVECTSFMQNKNKTGMRIGMIIVILLIAANFISIFYSLGFQWDSIRCYGLIFQKIGWNEKILNGIIGIICIGTLNSWIVSSGMCMYENSKQGFFPFFLQNRNIWNVPYYSIILSAIGLFPLIFLKDSLSSLIGKVSSVVFIFYFTFSLAYFMENRTIASLLCTLFSLFMMLSGSMLYSFYMLCFSFVVLILRKISLSWNKKA